MRQRRLPMARDMGRMLRAIEASQGHHWPIVKASADKSGVGEVITALVPSALEVDPGPMVLGLVWDTLRGRRPRSRLEECFAQPDPALLVGQALPAPAFHDATVGRMLERLDAIGTMTRFTAWAGRADTLWGWDKRHVHLDTTSRRVSGDDALPEDREVACTLTPGDSQDQRPDLTPCVRATWGVDRAVPLWGEPHAGNASDTTVHHPRLSTRATCLAPPGVAPGAYTDVAEAALVPAENLAALGDTCVTAAYQRPRAHAGASCRKPWRTTPGKRGVPWPRRSQRIRRMNLHPLFLISRQWGSKRGLRQERQRFFTRQYQGLSCIISPTQLITGGRCVCQAPRT